MSDTPAKPEPAKAAATAVAVPVAAKAPAPVATVAKAVPVKPAIAPAEKPVATKPAPLAKAVRSAPRKPAAKPAKPVATKEITMADPINTITDKTKIAFADANDRAKASMEKSAKLFEDMNAFNKGNLEAMVESSKIAAMGAEEIAKYSADYARTTVEKANATLRDLAAVKSPTEFYQKQSEIAKQTLDAVASETAKFTENYLKLFGQIVQPYQNRFAVAADKLKAAA